MLQPPSFDAFGARAATPAATAEAVNPSRHSPQSAEASAPRDAAAITAPAVKCPVLLKLDDLRIARPCEKWERVFQAAVEHECKISVGIISEGTENPASAGRFRGNVTWLKGWRTHPLIEFWNHGHSHMKSTYCGPSREAQVADLRLNAQAVKPVFGRGLGIFGAPFNAVDAQTAHACLAAGIQVMFYAPEPVPAGLINIPAAWFFDGAEEIAGEKLRVPSVKRILRALQTQWRESPLCVVQLHPLGWDEVGFAAFLELVAGMKERGHPTVTVASFLEQRVPGPRPA